MVAHALFNLNAAVLVLAGVDSWGLFPSAHPFTKHYADSVSAWGEEKLLAAIRRWLGAASPRSPFGIGDDCATRAPRGSRTTS